MNFEGVTVNVFVISCRMYAVPIPFSFLINLLFRPGLFKIFPSPLLNQKKNPKPTTKHTANQNTHTLVEKIPIMDHNYLVSCSCD